METVKQCREDGYRGKLKIENEDDDVAGDGEREWDIEDWINGDRRAEEGRTIHATAAADGRTGWFLGLDILEVPYFRRLAA